MPPQANIIPGVEAYHGQSLNVSIFSNCTGHGGLIHNC